MQRLKISILSILICVMILGTSIGVMYISYNIFSSYEKDVSCYYDTGTMEVYVTSPYLIQSICNGGYGYEWNCKDF